MGVTVFHHVGDEGEYTNPIEQIMAYEGVVTFDGAYTSVWEYREQLAELEPILFVQGDTVGRSGVMNWEQIRALADFYQFVIGWHGWTHRRLTELPDHVVINELLPAKEIEGVKLYAYPHGDFDQRTAELVKQMGFLRGYSTTQGEEGNDFAIPREYL